MTILIERFDTAGPTDTVNLEAAIARIGRERIHKLVLFVKIEGDFGDGLREQARTAINTCLARIGLASRSQVLLAQGCEGVATPFIYLLAEMVEISADRESLGLVIGVARSEPIAEEETERLGLLARVGDTVRAALADASLTREQAVMVFVTLPQPRSSPDLHEHLLARRIRGLAALSAGVALGEINPSRAIDAIVDNDPSVYSRRVQSFAAAEANCAEVIVLGNRPGAGGDYMVTSVQPSDLIDMRAIKRMLLDAGMRLDVDGELEAPERVAALFLKSGPSRDGQIRGARTMIFSSKLAPEHHSRAAVSGALAALLGTTRFFSTGDPIHSAPDGGAVACAIVRKH